MGTFADAMQKQYEEEDRSREIQRAKEGDYTGDNCPNCGRLRVMMGEDGKRRCEKCCWCVEDNDYDYEFIAYMRCL